MTIEPHHATTVSRRPVMPPQPDKPKGAPTPEVMLAALMAEDARHVRKRFAHKWGTHSGGIGDPNESRRAEAAERREKFILAVMAILREHGPMTAKSLWRFMKCPEDRVRSTMRALAGDKRIVMGERVREGHVWRLAE